MIARHLRLVPTVHSAFGHRVRVCSLILMLAIMAGCNRGPAPQQPSAARPAEQAAPSDTSYLPQDIFGPDAIPGAVALKPVDLKKLSDSELKFGIAPRRSSTVEYQPDVIVMEQGDKAIRSISSNGLEWRFDANAPHVNEFQLGKIVFATGRAVGRIISLKKEGDSVAVVLGPIQLTDVIRNGKFKMDQPISVDNMIAYVAPDFPQPPDPQDKAVSQTFGSKPAQVERAVVISRVQRGVWTPISAAEMYSDGRRVTFQKVGNDWKSPQFPHARLDPALQLTSHMPSLQYAAYQQGAPPLIPGVGLPVPQPTVYQNPPLTPAKTAGTAPIVDIGDIRAVAVANPSYIGLQLYSRNAPGGLFVFAETEMRVTGLHLHFVLNIVDGRILKCGIDMGGVLGVKLYMDSHSTKDFQVNLHKKFWVPVDLTIPLGLGNTFGIPFSVTFNMGLVINSGFSAKQSILHAEGDYSYTGGLWAGYDNGDWKATTASDIKAITDIGRTVQGISVGINSLVMGASVRAMVGIGAFGFNTGVYVGMRFDGTMLRAPDIGFACRQGTVDAFLDSGVGYSMPGFVVDVVNKLLSAFTHYQIDRVGTLLKGPSKDLWHGITQIPGHCASPQGGGSGGAPAI